MFKKKKTEQMMKGKTKGERTEKYYRKEHNLEEKRIII